MALVSCPECGRENVSDSAVACPNCGYGVKEHFERVKHEEEEQAKREALELERQREENYRQEELKEKRRQEEIKRIETEQLQKIQVVENLKDQEIRRKRRKGIAIISSVIIIFLAVISIVNINMKNNEIQKEKIQNEKNLTEEKQNLTQYATEQFELDFQELLFNMNKDNLVVNATYNFEEINYEQSKNELNVICSIKYTSDNIKEYYTNISDGANALTLFKLLRSAYAYKNQNKNYIYNYNNDKTINIEIKNEGIDGIAITDNENNEYVYEVADSIQLKINDICLHSEDRPQSTSSYSSSDSSNSNSTSSSATYSNQVEATDDEKGVCWALAIEVVESQLKSPSSAEFPFSYGDEDVSITKDGNTYTVIGWVDAQNSFGASIRSNFVVTMIKSGSGKNAKFTADSCYIDE